MGDLDNLMDRVRAATLAGSFDELPHLSNDLSKALDGLSVLTEAQARAVLSKAKSNTVVLQAAIQGMRAAQRRLLELREAASGHRTYGREGMRTALVQQPTLLKHRL